MSASVNPVSSPAARALAVLADVQGPFHPGTRLFAAHRRDIVAALTQAGFDPDGDVFACVNQTLATAEAYEADGMLAFIPNWGLLVTRVARLDQPTGSATDQPG